MTTRPTWQGAPVGPDHRPQAAGRPGAPTDHGVSDRRLLERFSARQDPHAFEALLHRHGPMVLAVCRRILHDEYAAEDAFQATFLVLARKAHSIARPELLANWLYGVAVRIACKARARAARCPTWEGRAAEVWPPSPA